MVPKLKQRAAMEFLTKEGCTPSQRLMLVLIHTKHPIYQQCPDSDVSICSD